MATAMSIVSGAVAERMKLWAFLVFAVVMTGFIYPMQGYWKWGGGFLDGLGFNDFAGSGIVHLCGATAALAGVLLLGARKGKYGPNGEIHPIPGANLPLATLGTFILWLGWFGFNGGSELKVSDVDEANAVALVFVNTNMAAAGGVVGAMVACPPDVRQDRSDHGAQRRSGRSGGDHGRTAGAARRCCRPSSVPSAVCWWCSPFWRSTR